jgi:hypothetical protein
VQGSLIRNTSSALDLGLSYECFVQIILLCLLKMHSLHSSRKVNVLIFLNNMQDLVAHQLGTELLLSWGLSESLNTGQGLSLTNLRGTEVPAPTFSFLDG